MFRVLSEEEARKVKRWQAPELSAPAGELAATRQEVMSRLSAGSEDVPGERGQAVSLPVREELTSAAALQSAVAPPARSGSAEPGAASQIAGQAVDTTASRSTTSVPMPHPSADMLQSSYDEGYSRGFEEGKLSGVAEGHARGFAEGNADLQLQGVAQLRAVIAEFERSQQANLDESVECELLQMTVDIARLVIHEELTSNPEALGSLVKAGMNQLTATSATQTTVRLHPLDAQIVRQVLQDEELLDILDDATLARGACIVQSGPSTVHAGVEDWLDKAAEQVGLATRVQEEMST
ncbi:MAG: hypothetical protein HKN42_11965 [Granulosicoccus sp.]|nr:hypothetical protein [Granulosicoccus sp.]